MPIRLCACGCGQSARIATRTRKDRAEISGKPAVYAKFHDRKNRSAVVDSEHRRCYCCKNVKPVDSFSPHVRNKSGRSGICRECNKLKSQKWRDKNRQLLRDRMFAAHLRSKFGISVDKYNTVLNLQNGTCAICRKPEVEKRKGTVKRLAVDHDHRTGKVRGLLCQHCNTALGSFDENPNLLRAAIKYLQITGG